MTDINRIKIVANAINSFDLLDIPNPNNHDANPTVARSSAATAALFNVKPSEIPAPIANARTGNANIVNTIQPIAVPLGDLKNRLIDSLTARITC
ncbi:hypothetical protein [Dehalogenimonas formicexedens]|uniref:hypothetical protein n=1 Tax=Dehalogenimonas formicexedens TaxID=1839801 RepID=UPI0011AB64C0|nr:hypothetical protein [Dehalogenimonas formicexedens]